MKKHTLLEIKELLDEKFFHYNSKAFIERDPISIPHLFSKKEDIEIAGFFAASLAWGNRKSIIQNASKLMQAMDFAPFEFVTQHSKKDLKQMDGFVHRTFNSIDLVFFIQALRHIYLHKGGLEASFGRGAESGVLGAITAFREDFLFTKHQTRSEKHLSNPSKNSSAKRLCMYLRWMVRTDKRGVDFGIWKQLSPPQLHLPLDVHTGNVSRALGLLQRKQNDWQSVEEITRQLKTLDPTDPIKYDFALFGLGIEGYFK